MVYEIYLNGKKKATTSATASGKTFSYKVTGLSQYTDYKYYVVAIDTWDEKAQSSTYGPVRTYCPGYSYCYDTEYCSDAYVEKNADCPTCGGDGKARVPCTETSYDGTESMSSTCSAYRSNDGFTIGEPCSNTVSGTASTCSKCNGYRFSAYCSSCGALCTAGGGHSFVEGDSCSACNSTGKRDVTHTCSHKSETSHYYCATHKVDAGSSGYHKIECEHGLTEEHDS